MKSNLSVIPFLFIIIDIGLASPDSEQDKSYKDDNNNWKKGLSEPGSPDKQSKSYTWDIPIDTDQQFTDDKDKHVTKVHAKSLYGADSDPDRDSISTTDTHPHRHKNVRIPRRQKDELSGEDTTFAPDLVTDNMENSVTAIDEPSWPENCTHCALREANRKYRLDQIQREILAKLRLQHPPNITDKRLPEIPEIAEWLSNFPDDNPGPGNDENPVVSIMSMINLAQRPPPDKALPDMNNVCYFEFQPDVEPGDIVSAKLGVYVRPVHVNTGTVTMFLVYKVKPRRRGNTLMKRKRIHLNEEDTNKWHKFDVTAVVKGWVRNPDNNYGLQIRLFDDEGTSLAIVDPQDDQEKLKRPYIQLSLKKTRRDNSNRDKRMSLDCTQNESSAQRSCCRYPMKINFTEMEWDWILAPKVVEVNYCSGECDIYFLNNPYIHFVRQTSGDLRHFVGACCVPRIYSSMKMIYLSGNTIHIGIIKGIIVETCGCT